MYYCALSLGVLQHILPRFLVTCAIWCVLEYSFRELSLKVLEKCTKNLIGHSRLAFNNHESNIDC